MRHRPSRLFPTSAFALTVLLATLGRAEDKPAVADAGPSAAAKALTVAVDGEKIIVNGKSLSVPCERADLEAALGKPDREADLANLILVWDDLGVFAHVKKDVKKVRQLSIALDKDDLKFWPAKTFAGTATVDGAPLTAKSTADELNKAKTGDKFKPYEQIAAWQVIEHPSVLIVLHAANEKVGSKDAKVSCLAFDARLATKKP